MIYELPQLASATRGYSGAVLVQEDEPHYAARLVRAVQGTDTFGAVWTAEHQRDPAMIPSLPEQILAAPARLLAVVHVDVSASDLIVCYRFLLPFLGFLAFFAALRAVGIRAACATLLLLWVYVDPGAISFKVFGGLLWNAHLMPFNRFSNPLFGLILFAVAFFCAAKALRTPFGLEPASTRRALGWALGAGVLTGGMFYVSLFYWTHMVGTLCVATLWLRTPGRFKVVAVSLACALLVSIPYWVSVRQLHGNPVYADLVWRNGLLVSGRGGGEILSNKTVWFFLLAAVPLAFRKEQGLRFLTAGIAAGVGCVFSSVITNVTLQNSHWYYTTIPLLGAGALTTLDTLGRRPAFAKFRRLAVPSGAAVAALILLGGAKASWASLDWATQANKPGLGATDAPYAEAWSWLRAHASPEAVVVASEGTMGFVPLRSGLRVWTQAHTATETITFEEIYERNAVLWKLQGFTAARLETWLCEQAGNISQWDFGFPVAEHGRLVGLGRPAFDHDLSCLAAHNVALEYGKTENPLRALGSKYRIDYLVRGPMERDWPAAEQTLNLEPVAAFGTVRIDRVVGVRDNTMKAEEARGH